MRKLFAKLGSWMIGTSKDNQNVYISETANGNYCWKAPFHGLVISFPNSFEMIHQINREEKTLFGLIDQKNGASLVVKITGDIAKRDLTDSAFYDAITEQYENIHSGNKVYTEKEKLFLGEKFHCMLMLLTTEKWGPLHHMVLMLRKNGFLYSFQFAYPTLSDEHYSDELPADLKFVYESIKIDFDYAMD